MKALKLIAFACLAVAPLAARAETLSLDFNYNDLNGLVTGKATFTAIPISGNVFAATAGTLVVTAPTEDHISGTYSLFANSASPNYQVSPTGLFYYDNLIFLGSNPIVSNPGILAFGGDAGGNVPEGTGREINFFSTGAHTYDLYTGVDGGYPYAFEFSDAQGSVTAGALTNRSLSAAPEPASWLTMGTFLLVAVFYGKTRARARVAAAVAA